MEDSQPMPVSRKRKPSKKKKKQEPKWESFERIVAAIHLAESKGADVTWNKEINSRQFDVVIRFKAGFYDYLTLIECKDYKSAVPVDRVEAFVTKAQDHKAHKAIMVSANGFQSGAKEVAQRHNIELYTLRQINKLPEDMLTDIFLSFVVINPFAFRHEDRPAFIFSQDPNILQHQIEKIRFTTYGKLKLSDLIRPFAQLVYPTPLPGVPEVEKVGFPFKRATSIPQRSGWKMMDNTELIHPDSEERIPVSEFLFIYWAETARLINPSGPDPTVFKSLGKQYEYKNELNNDVTVIDSIGLPMGVNTVFEEKTFYHNPHMNNFIYYCEKIEGDVAIMLLLRSYQYGKLVRMECREPINASKAFIEITDEKEIEIGEKLYADFMEYRKTHPPLAASPQVQIWIS